MSTKIQLPTFNGVPIITYGLIGLTTVVFAYIAFQDNIDEESEDNKDEKGREEEQRRDVEEEQRRDVEEERRRDVEEPLQKNSILEQFSPNKPADQPFENQENQNKNAFMGGKSKRKTKSKKSKSKKDKKSKTKKDKKSKKSKK